MAIPFGQNLSRLTEIAKVDPNRVAQMAAQKTPDDPRLVYILALEQAKRARDAVQRDEAMKQSQQMPNVLQKYEQESGIADLMPQQSPEQVDGLAGLAQPQGGIDQRDVARNVGGVLDFQQKQQQEAMQKVLAASKAGGLPSAAGAANVMSPKSMAAGGLVAFKTGGQAPFTDEMAEQARDLERRLSEARARREAAERGLRAYSGLRQRSDPAGYEEAQRNAAEAEQAVIALEQEYSGLTRISPRFLGSVPSAARPVIQQTEERLAPPAPTTQPAGIAAPSFADSDIAERADRMTGMVTPPSEGRVVQSMAAPETTPAIPAPPTVTPIPPAYTPAKGSLAGLPGDMASIMGQAAIGQAQRDPTSESRIEEERVRALRQLTPEQRRTLEGGISNLDKYYQERAARARDDEITRALIGAAGKSTFGMTGAGFAAGALGAREAQAAERLKGIEALNKARSGLIDLERSPVQEGITAGAQVRKEGEEGRRTGISSGVQALGYQSQAETARENIAATSTMERAKLLSSQADREMNRYFGMLKDEANRIARQGQADSRTERLLKDYQQSLARYEADVEKAFREENSLLLAQEQTNSLSKEAKNQLQLQRLLRDKKISDKRRELEEYIMPLRSRLGMTSAGSDGFGAMTVK